MLGVAREPHAIFDLENTTFPAIDLQKSCNIAQSEVDLKKERPLLFKCFRHLFADPTLQYCQNSIRI